MSRRITFHTIYLPVSCRAMQWFDVPSGASQEEIRREYKRLAKLHHPDRSPPQDRIRATSAFQEINDAYEHLMALRPRCPCQHKSHDLFEDIKRTCFDLFPSPTVSGFPCTLEELYTGGIKHFEWRGQGRPSQLIPVRIAPGTRHAAKLLIPGAIQTGSIPSDLLLIVVQTTHPVFVRRVDDLYASKRVSQCEASSGWTCPLTLLDGSLLHVEHGPTSDSQARVVIPGAGMPSEPPYRRGDLIVTFDVA